MKKKKSESKSLRIENDNFVFLMSLIIRDMTMRKRYVDKH